MASSITEEVIQEHCWLLGGIDETYVQRFLDATRRATCLGDGRGARSHRDPTPGRACPRPPSGISATSGNGRRAAAEPDAQDRSEQSPIFATRPRPSAPGLGHTPPRLSPVHFRDARTNTGPASQFRRGWPGRQSRRARWKRSASGHGGRYRAEPLRANEQPRRRDFRQERELGSRPSTEQCPVDGLRGSLRERERRGSDRPLRPVGRSMGFYTIRHRR